MSVEIAEPDDRGAVTSPINDRQPLEDPVSATIPDLPAFANASALRAGPTEDIAVEALAGGSDGRGESFSGPLLEERPAPADGPRNALLAGLVPRRILVVDDNLDAATSLSDLLRIAGMDVAVAHDGPATLELARVHRPEVIVLDLGLPQMDGYEVARRLRLEHGDQPLIVALTGYGQPEARRRSQAVGFDHHLVKPLDLKRLRTILLAIA